MTSDNIWNRVRERPFRSFKLNTSDGKSFEVLHPEMITVSKNRITVAIYDPTDRPGEDVPSRDVSISPLHVASVEDLPPWERSTEDR